jgi:Anticodon-binding domain
LGQAVFEKLLKACGEVVWTDQTTILVNGHIRVEEPYEPGHERFVAANGNNNNKNTLDDGSMDRVKKIVAAAVDDFRSKT